MRAFWWFEENAIAGMARPGFNVVHWFDLPFDEGVLLGWLGQLKSPSGSIDQFFNHLSVYGPKVFPFYQLDAVSGPRAVRHLQEPEGLLETRQRLSKHIRIFESFSIQNDVLQFELNQRHLDSEIKFFKGKGIQKIVSLTEHHHSKDILDEHFDTHHFSIQDLSAPELDQVIGLAEILKGAKTSDHKIAVHCLAGIGRTSTMLLAAHIVLGRDFEEMKQLIKKRNPKFALVGSQANFQNEVAKKFGQGSY